MTFTVRSYKELQQKICVEKTAKSIGTKSWINDIIGQLSHVSMSQQ